MTIMLFCSSLMYCKQINAGVLQQMIQERVQKIEKLQNSLTLLKVCDRLQHGE